MSRIRLYRTEAVVLSRRDYGEADRILTLITPGRGKVGVIAKGVRRLTSRSAGHIELFTHANVMLARGRNLDVLTQAESLATYPGLRTDLTRLTCAYHLAELVDRLTTEEQGSTVWFETVKAALRAAAEAPDPALAVRYFELRALAVAGYRPELFVCVGCGDDLRPADNAFSADRGGVLCPDCRGEDSQALALEPNTFKVLRYLQTQDWQSAGTLTVSPETHRRLETHMVGLLRHILERDLKSVEFLANLRRISPAQHP